MVNPVAPALMTPKTSFFCSEAGPAANENEGCVDVGPEGVVFIAGLSVFEEGTPNENPEVAGLAGSAGLAKKLGTAAAAVSAGLVVGDGLKKLFDIGTVAGAAPVGPIEGAVTVMDGTFPEALDAAAAAAAAASLSFLSLSAFSFSNLSFSCRSFSCLSFSSRTLSAAAALSLSALSLASLCALSLASISISFFLFASRTFMIALASSSCFSHFEKTFAGADVRGLPFVLSDKPGVPGDSAPLTDDAK
jgi:hypothetical protein